MARSTTNSARVAWAGPAPAAGALGHYSLRYRTERADAWITLPPFEPTTTRAEVTAEKLPF